MKNKRISWLKRLIPIAFLLVYIIGLSEIFYNTQIRQSADHCSDEMAMNLNDAAVDVATVFNNSLAMLDLASDAIMMKADIDDEDAPLDYLAGVQRETVFDRIDVLSRRQIKMLTTVILQGKVLS